MARLDARPFEGPGVLSALIAPGRGMMLLQARARLGDGREIDLLDTPDLATVAARLGGGPDDFAGNASFDIGGAILTPFANRIVGRPLAASREIETEVDGVRLRLPRNWGGKAHGAQQYAMHGLILATPVSDIDHLGASRLVGRLDAGDFDGRWPSRTRLEIAWSLEAGALELQVSATNVGDTELPIGVGWHPWFRVASGRRELARLTVPAAARQEVNNYDEVLPTGRLLAVAGTAYDFRTGAALGRTYLDEGYVDLIRGPGGSLTAGFDDIAAGYCVRLAIASPGVKAIQVHAPLGRQVVVIEPQFNWIDPFGPQWAGRDTGMMQLAPGATGEYLVRLTVV